MKRIISFSLWLLLIVLCGCKNISDRNDKTREGTITYRISYPDSVKYGIRYNFFPKEIILIFKDEKAAFIATAGLGMIQLVNLLDFKKKKFTSLLIDNLRENYGCELKDDEIDENESYPEYRFDLKSETKTIAGLKCNRAVVEDISNNKSFDVYYYDKIRFTYGNSPFKDFDYLFTEYTHTINNLTMKLTAISFDFSTPVDTSLFAVKGDYRWVNQKAFYAHLNEL